MLQKIEINYQYLKNLDIKGSNTMVVKGIAPDECFPQMKKFTKTPREKMIPAMMIEHEQQSNW